MRHSTVVALCCRVGHERHRHRVVERVSKTSVDRHSRQLRTRPPGPMPGMSLATMLWAVRRANRGDRSQRSKITLWNRPSPRMAASAVCESSRRRNLAYVKPKSRANPGTCRTNAAAVSRCCHSPLWGAAYACRRLSCPGPLPMHDHELYRLLPPRRWPALFL